MPGIGEAVAAPLVRGDEENVGRIAFALRDAVDPAQQRHAAFGRVPGCEKAGIVGEAGIGVVRESQCAPYHAEMQLETSQARNTTPDL